MKVISSGIFFFTAMESSRRQLYLQYQTGKGQAQFFWKEGWGKVISFVLFGLFWDNYSSCFCSLSLLLQQHLFLNNNQRCRSSPWSSQAPFCLDTDLWICVLPFHIFLSLVWNDGSCPSRLKGDGLWSQNSRHCALEASTGYEEVKYHKSHLALEHRDSGILFQGFFSIREKINTLGSGLPTQAAPLLQAWLCGVSCHNILKTRVFDLNRIRKTKQNTAQGQPTGSTSDEEWKHTWRDAKESEV